MNFIYASYHAFRSTISQFSDTFILGNESIDSSIEDSFQHLLLMEILEYRYYVIFYILPSFNVKPNGEQSDPGVLSIAQSLRHLNISYFSKFLCKLPFSFYEITGQFRIFIVGLHWKVSM